MTFLAGDKVSQPRPRAHIHLFKQVITHSAYFAMISTSPLVLISHAKK